MRTIGRNAKLRQNNLITNLTKEKYIFHPRQNIKNEQMIHSSFSAQNIFNMNPKENTFYIKKKVPPIYYYRKIESPYIYNISSIPEYLIKTNEEKNFMNRLKMNENDKIKLNELKKRIKIKDRYKPDVLDVQTMLKYNPDIFLNSFKSESNKKNNSSNNSLVLDNNDSNIKYDSERNKQISDDDQVKYKYKLSDIYNLKKEKVLTNKSAEKYLFKDNNINNNLELKKNNFNITSTSKSDWIPNRNYGTKMNFFSSVSYNILSPMNKGFNKFITPTELNKNNLYNENPSFHKVKSISEFIDLSRVSSRNNLEIFNKNKKGKIPNFKFKGNVATDHLNAYHINKDLIPTPT